MKKWEYVLIGLSAGIVIGVIISATFVSLSIDKNKLIDWNKVFTVIEEPEVEVNSKYPNLNSEEYLYIQSLCEAMNVNMDLVIGILFTENPGMKVDATHLNQNGTIDIGLFQLNDRYLWSTFVPAYWVAEVEFDPFNWKHNSFVAISHISYLKQRMKSDKLTILSYNCGIGAVINNAVPESSYRYLEQVNSYVELFNLVEEK